MITIPTTAFRKDYSNLLKTIDTEKAIMLTKHGASVAVVISNEEYVLLLKFKEAATVSVLG